LRAMVAAPITLPLGSRTGDTVIETSIETPSLVAWMVS